MGGSRRFSVHRALGGDGVGDVLLWKKWGASIGLLISSSTLWFLFERAGYNLLSFIANVLLLLVVILFFWAKSASLLNRPLPPLPDLEVSEESLMMAADVIRVWINHVLLIAHDIAINGNVKLFLQVSFGLWLISYVGSFFNFLTMLYLGILICLSVPVIYDKYQDRIEDRLILVLNVCQTQYRKFDDMVLRKIPLPLSKDKKTK